MVFLWLIFLFDVFSFHRMRNNDLKNVSRSFKNFLIYYPNYNVFVLFGILCHRQLLFVSDISPEREVSIFRSSATLLSSLTSSLKHHNFLKISTTLARETSNTNDNQWRPNSPKSTNILDWGPESFTEFSIPIIAVKVKKKK